MFSPVELKKGCVYLLQCDGILTPDHVARLKESLRHISKDKGVEFIVVDGGVKLACAIDLKGLSFEETKEIIEHVKC